MLVAHKYGIMAEIDQTAEELFFKLRNRFPKINMGDSDGKATTSPKDTRFFNFEYDHEGVPYGEITCSLVDGTGLKVYFSQDITEKMDEEHQEYWFAFLRELRKFAKTNLLTFDVRDINKQGLNQADINFSTNYHKDKSDVNESKITWQRRGRYSEGNQNNVRIHVVHKNKLEENPNNRLNQVEKIYLVNENNERFLLPFTSVMGAKAMANHVNRGGTPYDDAGQTIGRVVAEMKNLSRFQMATRNKTFESQDPYRVIRATQLVKEEMRKHLKRLAGGRYFEESLQSLQEMLQVENAPQADTLKTYFVQQYYNESLDAWLGSAAMAYKRCEDNNMDLDQDIPLTEEDDSIASKDQTDIRAAKPAKIGDTIELYSNPHTDAEMRKLIKSQPLRGMISLILADIASRAVDDETAILASKADAGEFTRGHQMMIKAYMQDLFSDAPTRKGEEERRTINYPSKRKTAEEEYESAIMGLGEEDKELDIVPDPSMRIPHPGDRDREPNYPPKRRIEPSFDTPGAPSIPLPTVGPKDRFREEGPVPMPPTGRPSSAPMPPARPKDLDNEPKDAITGAGGNVRYSPSKPGPGKEEDPTMGGAIANTGMRTIQELLRLAGVGKEMVDEEEMEAGQCNHTNEGSMCPVHGMEECGSSMRSAAIVVGEQEQVADEGNEFSGALAKAKASNQDEFEVDGKKYKVKDAVSEMRRLAGLDECWDGMMMGDEYDTVGAQQHSAEMDRAKRLEKAISDKAHADAEAQTSWVIDQIRAQPVWTPPNLDEPREEEQEVGSHISTDHPHADQKQNDSSDDQEVDEVILGPNDQPDTTDVAVSRFKQGLKKEISKNGDEEMDEVSDRDPRHRFRSLHKANNKLGEEGDKHDHKPDQDSDGVPDWADKKPGRDDQENKPEIEESHEFYKAMREMRRLSGLSEQSYSSTAPSDPNNPIDQAVATMRAMSPAQRNAITARNAAAEKAFYDANPHLVGDTATMQKLRDQGKLDFNPGTVSKKFDDQDVDPVYAQNRAAVDAVKQQRYREIDTAKSQDAIDKIQSKSAWSPGDEPWPGANAPAAQTKPAVTAPAASQPDTSLDSDKAALQSNLDQWETNKSTLDNTSKMKGMFGGGLKEGEDSSVNLLRKLAGL